MAIIETVNLDLKRPSQFVIIRVQQNDYLGNKIKVNITLDGEEYSIPTGTRAQLSMMAGNIVPVLHDCEVVNNQVIFTITSDMTSYSGRFQAQIRLMNAASGSVIKTLKFHLLVEEETGLSDAIVQTSEFNTLDNALVRVEDLVVNVGNSLNVVADVMAVENQRVVDENSRNTNESTRIQNENDRILKESLRWNFRTLTQAEYDALPQSEKLDPNMIYEIIGSSEDFPQELAELINRTESAALAAEELVVNKAGINDLIATKTEAFSGQKTQAKFMELDNKHDEVMSQLRQKASRQYVSYTEFGAILDGVTDDSTAIIACHQYANEHNLSVIQNGGTLLCNFTVDVKTSCTLEMDFIINDTTPFTVYNIVSDTQVEDFTYEGSFDMGQINGFQGFKGKFFVPVLNNEAWSLGLRNGLPGDGVYYHRQPIAVDNSGVLISAPIYQGNSGTFTIKHMKDIHEKGITFKGGHVITTLSKIGFPRFIKCSRNNCVIKDISLRNTSLPTTNNNYASGFIEIIGCANTTLENINGLNNSVDVTTAYSYLIDITDAYNVKIKHANLTQGWGAIASHYCDTFTVESSVLNRCDNHYGMFGKYLISNTTMTGIGTICVGYGNANMTLSNLTIANTLPTSYVIYTRQDFNITFSGTLTLDNIRFSNEVFGRIIQYQVGNGTANTNLSIGSFNVIATNVVTTKALIHNSTSNAVAVKIFNSTIVPCTSTGSCTVDVYNSALRSLVTTGTTRIHNSQIISFGAVFNSTLYLFGGYIFPEINNSALTLYATGCQFNNNIVAANVVNILTCFATTPKTVTANTKNIVSSPTIV